MSLLTIFCEKSPTGNDDQSVMPSLEKKSNSQSFTLSVPDSIPKDVDSLIVAKAASFQADGIQIVQIEKKGKIEYLATYFKSDADGFEIKAKKIADKNKQFKDIPSDIESELATAHKNSEGLGKTSTYLVCFPLAEFYVLPNLGGVNFRFSQVVDLDLGEGYYHKIINDLRYVFADCYSGTYGGFLNDAIVSHRWTNWTHYPYTSYGNEISVFKNPNRSGTKYTFKNGNQWRDDFWDELLFKGLFCQVTSIDMGYFIRSN